ncbi:hypothetical protein INT47_005344 [Mucor saturninus]|uniref:MULE transposase domain-containing protein n=1 Tax=Mucor saturninus TaxID=64648 RepID=A0A8H7QFV6_9FUNG|nr:hypothetical protein INT47_005344 [Mucor saturninus]
MLSQKTIKLVTTMIKAGNRVPEIRKTVGGRYGQSILSHHDSRNWKVGNTELFTLSSLDNDALNLMSHIKSRGYLVSYGKGKNGSESKCSLTSIFFKHKSAMEVVRNRGEVFIIDATYKTNNLGMPLISIQNVSQLGGKFLMSTPIAYAFVANEKTETYLWFLKAFKQAISSCSREGLTLVFVTDKCSALMNAIEQFFPTAKPCLVSGI